jgi:hypothetical protein
MVAKRVIVGVSFAAALAGAWAVAPALGAEDGRAVPRKVAAPSPGIGSFTPASGDPKLAAVLARAGISDNGFRFTPSGAGKPGARALTVAVRARSSNTTLVAADRLPAAASPVALAPVAYNLGVAVGWKRFALSGDLAKVDLAGQPGSRESADLGVSYNGRAFSGRVKAEAARPLGTEPRLVAEVPSYSLDVGGAYRVARNLDVTAGVRYKSERERLPQLTDNRRDSQSVYVGTAFRF